MSWQNVGLIMLRTMLNDAGCGESTYSDQRLEDVLITSAYMLPVEVEFVTTYTIDIEAQTISPDPTATSADGKDFMSLMVLKSACLVDEGNFRAAALVQGVSARCGPAQITTNGYGTLLSTVFAEGPCKAYENLKNKYNFDYAGKGILRAVMGPFAANDFDPSANRGSLGMSSSDYYPHRER